MKVVKQKIPGRLVSLGDRTGLFLYSKEAATDDLVYLSYAFVTHGLEELVLPALILDDWGREIKSLELYRWVRDHGADFPRAEVFGSGTDGEERQHFLREFDLGIPYPVYSFTERQAPAESGTLVTVALTGRHGLSEPQRCRDLSGIDVAFPLAAARLQWWYVPLEAESAALKAWFTAMRLAGAGD